MSDFTHDHLFSRQFLWLKTLVIIYVIALLLAHWRFPATVVWEISAFFSIAMNLTYPFAAWRQGHSQGIEGLVAVVLVIFSGLGLIVSPLFVITAIFLHGCWDIAKSRGHGTPFFAWYTAGCVLVDWLYSSTLLVYYIYTNYLNLL